MRPVIAIITIFSVFFNFGPGWASKTPDYVVARCIQFTFLNQLGQLKYVLENSNHQLYNKNLHLLTQISKEMELEDFSIKKTSKTNGGVNVDVDLILVSKTSQKTVKSYRFFVGNNNKIKEIIDLSKKRDNKNLILKKKQAMADNRVYAPKKIKQPGEKTTEEKSYISIYPVYTYALNYTDQIHPLRQNDFVAAGLVKNKGENLIIMKFDIPGDVVKKASLQLYVDYVDGDIGCNMGVFKINNLILSEKNSTSLNEIEISEEPYVEFSIKKYPYRLSLDITDLVLSWITGEKNFGLAIRPMCYHKYRSVYYLGSVYNKNKQYRPRLDLILYNAKTKKTTVKKQNGLFVMDIIGLNKGSISHLNEKIQMRIKYRGTENRTVKVIIKNIGMDKSIYEIPLYFEPNVEKDFIVRAPIYGFTQGRYEASIYDMGMHKLSSMKFNIN